MLNLESQSGPKSTSIFWPYAHLLVIFRDNKYDEKKSNNLTYWTAQNTLFNLNFSLLLSFAFRVLIVREKIHSTRNKSMTVAIERMTMDETNITSLYTNKKFLLFPYPPSPFTSYSICIDLFVCVRVWLSFWDKIEPQVKQLRGNDNLINSWRTRNFLCRWHKT